jgi:hypothetical protein
LNKVELDPTVQKVAVQNDVQEGSRRIREKIYFMISELEGKIEI